MTTADKILEVAKEGLSLWKTFIATRQEAYNRQQDKKQVAAIDMAEKYIFEADELINQIEDHDPEFVKSKKIRGLVKQMDYFRKRFFKFH